MIKRRRDVEIARDVARLLFSVGAISLSPRKPYRFTSGMLSPIYLDNRLIISYPDVRSKIVDYYIETIEELIGSETIDLISGTATAAIPHASFIADRLEKPMVYVEPAKGERGRAKIGGRLGKKQRVLVIEDHISTGGSSIGNVLAVRGGGGIVKECIATTTYQMKKAQDAFDKHRVSVHSLSTVTNILDVAVEEGYIDKSERDVVQKWTVDPTGWGKAMGFE